MEDTKYYQIQKSYRFRWFDLREPQPRLEEYVTSERRGTQTSVKSPRIDGKIVFKENPYYQRSYHMYNNVCVPSYWPGTSKIQYYFETPRPFDVGYNDSRLKTMIQNKLATRLTKLVRDKSVNLSVHLGEFYKNLNWFERRLSEAAMLIRAIVSKRGRIELWKKLLSKDQRDFQYYKRIYEKHGTLPRPFHSHPDYYPKRNRHRIIKEIQNDLHNRDKSIHKELADLQLEWSYAVSPILQDCEKLANKIDNYDLSGMPVKVTAGGSSNQTEKFGSGINSYTVSTDTKVVGRVSGKITLRNSNLNTLAQFGFSNWALTFWELTTMSFVIDWFYPIGTWLEQFTALDGWDCSEMSTTITTTSFINVTMPVGAWSTGSTKVKTREKRAPEFDLVFYNPFTSFRRGVNQISLATSLSSKR